MDRIRSFPLFIGLLFSFTASAQYQPVAEKDKAAAVTKIVALIRDQYVFPEKGKAIAAELLKQYQQGVLSTAANWQVFDSLVTKIIRTAGEDGHLYVRYSPSIVKGLHAPADSAAAEQEDPFLHGPEAREKNYGFREVKILDGNIGYIRINEINLSVKSLPVLYAAMQFIAGTRALVIDLRDNGGGGSDVGAVFETFFLPPNKPLLEVKKRTGTVETEKTVAWLLPAKYQRPLYILVNNRTASAAEAFAFILQSQQRAKIIGQPSAGAAHMNSWYPVNDEIFVSVSTAAPVLPGTTRTWEHTGIRPDIITQPGAELEMVQQQVSKQ